MRADNSRENLLSVAGEDGLSNNYQRLPGGARATAGAAPARDELARDWLAAAADWLDRYFQVSARGSTIATETRAGCIAWMTMSYILVVNPVILCRSGDASDPLSTESVMTATALSAAFGSFVAGILGDAPLGLMPGMGLNAYFTFGICKAFGVTWQEAFSCCFVSGALLSILSVLGVCQFIVSTVLSDHLKKAITAAIGVFQALIGFQVMGLVVSSPDTLVTLGNMSWTNERLYLALTGFCLISALLVVGEVHGSLLIGIWAMAIWSWIIGLSPPPAGVLSLPSFESAFGISFAAWDPGSDKFVGMVVGSAVLLFVALFDLAGVQYGLLGIAGLLKDGNVPRSTSIFASAGIATMFGSLLGTSPIIIASENSAGIIEGAKTGLMAVVVAILFFFSAFLGPLLSAVPHVATAVPLVLIGAFMMAPCRSIDWDNLRVAIPSFLTMTVVPFTYSIHTGIIAGILMDGFLTMFSKPLKEPKPLKEEPIMAIDAPTKVDCVVTNDLARTSSPACLSRRFSTPHMTLAASACNDTKVDDARKLLEKLCYAPPSAPQSPAMHGRDPGEEVAAEQALKKALEKFVEAH